MRFVKGEIVNSLALGREISPNSAKVMTGDADRRYLEYNSDLTVRQKLYRPDAGFRLESLPRTQH
jgi:hypothetical protein